MDAKIRVCLPRKYGRFMLFIDNNLLLPGARLHILNNIYRNKCRIYVGDQLDRWNELKEVLRVQTRAEFANILLDR
jgi:hypothetical protein